MTTMMSAPLPLLQLPPAAAPTEFYRELRERVRRMRLELGFSSHSHFTAAFREMYGRSPARFRRTALDR